MADVSRLPAALVAHWDWQRHAACRDLNQEMFFHPDGERDPSRSKRVADARAVCTTCPVLEACRSWAHAVQEPYGIWGGESEDERRAALRRERSTTPAA
ncbi:WhiB family transcriptional regulator [Actinomycetospora corticicola]|uniref:Transcriptional regulator WhiB n=1 Tax=Actinomycetospora corticicola TaxID=663602 RepID=A0A7Y9DRF4_9PSEU|nr:WhiB family redox-sensing transcriptional regulator [Actinomycetospora corticicola]